MFFTFDAAGSPLPNVTVVSSPSGKEGVYNDGGIDPGVSVTDAAGYGVIFGLPAGFVNLSFTAAGLTCEPIKLGGWPATVTGETVLAPIEASTLTIVRVQCQ
jgi:hypothetical protein